MRLLKRVVLPGALPQVLPCWGPADLREAWGLVTWTEAGPLPLFAHGFLTPFSLFVQGTEDESPVLDGLYNRQTLVCSCVLYCNLLAPSLSPSSLSPSSPSLLMCLTPPHSSPHSLSLYASHGRMSCARQSPSSGSCTSITASWTSRWPPCPGEGRLYCLYCLGVPVPPFTAP